ncbi:hypothetical protein GCM10011409_09520 [Lentibacillus populi]|uniref:Uncharacterized protein n=1 Tax=Lentibacillus populi TaxID=1827502 RepID=A0A9W5TVL8_9BACI|nr:hypothetical protein GCM10011409_09520 [Lentibacillus populi]
MGLYQNREVSVEGYFQIRESNDALLEYIDRFILEIWFCRLFHGSIECLHINQKNGSFHP